MSKFKVGDRVTTDGLDTRDFPKGYEFVVQGYDRDWQWDSFLVKGKCAQGWDSLVHEDWLKLVEQKQEVKIKMNNINYHLLNNSIIVNYLGKTVAISESDPRYETVIECIRNGELDNIPAIVETERAFEGTGLELRDGLLYESGNPIPTELNTRILKHKDLGLPFDSLLKFWENLKQNPSYNARQQLFAFLTHNGHPLTEDGCFIAYRGVTSDFKDIHSGTFDNKVGSVCEMPREQVDDNPNNTCSSGLHVACFDYAKGFGPQLVEVKVNPKDVVAVPTDYNGQKMRTCRFEVVAVGERPRTEAVYGQPGELNQEEVVETESESSEEEYGSDICDCGEERNPFHSFCGNCGYEF